MDTTKAFFQMLNYNTNDTNYVISGNICKISTIEQEVECNQNIFASLQFRPSDAIPIQAILSIAWQIMTCIFQYSTRYNYIISHQWSVTLWEIHVKIGNVAKSRLPIWPAVIRDRSEILHKARQYDCRALCKISEVFVDYKNNARARFGEISI